MKQLQTLLILMIFFLIACTSDSNTEIALRPNMIINRSMTIKKDTFLIAGADTISKPAIIIEGENIVVDFNGAVLIGTEHEDQPHTFSGLGIDIRKGKNITIKNLKVKGFKIGLLATSIDSLKILDSDFSHNYRQELKSTSEKEAMEDKLSYRQNDADQWCRYGMGIYLRHCNHTLVKNIRIIQGQNGLMMRGCNHGRFYNNNIIQNSGLGIGMYRSSFNTIMHNNLDWNTRGFSYGFYNRVQGAAGLFLAEQCNENKIAYNSVTHSGDGLFLWAGIKDNTDQSSGKNNLVYKNDFSYATDEVRALNFDKENKSDSVLVPPLKDGIDAFAKVAANDFTGQQYILIGKYGPYNFKHPTIWLREVEGNRYTFAIFGPFGNWKAIGGNGFNMMSQKMGAIPATLVLEAEENAKELSVELQYIGSAFVDEFGRFHKKGENIKLHWSN